MHCCRPSVYAELVEDRSQMCVHGTFTQHKLLGDLGVVQTIGHQPQDVDLSGGQPRGSAPQFVRQGDRASSARRIARSEFSFLPAS